MKGAWRSSSKSANTTALASVGRSASASSRAAPCARPHFRYPKKATAAPRTMTTADRPMIQVRFLMVSLPFASRGAGYRSEERRVGKECRVGGVEYHEKENE